MLREQPKKTRVLSGGKALRAAFAPEVSVCMLPPALLKIRRLKGAGGGGRFSADLLIVTDEALSESEKQLLKKITAALPVSQAAVLEIREPSAANAGRLLQEIRNSAFKKCLIASDTWKAAPESAAFSKTRGGRSAGGGQPAFGATPQRSATALKNRRFLQAPSLKQLTADPPAEATAKKRRLWAELQEWLADFAL